MRAGRIERSVNAYNLGAVCEEREVNRLGYPEVSRGECRVVKIRLGVTRNGDRYGADIVIEEANLSGCALAVHEDVPQGAIVWILGEMHGGTTEATR